MIKYELICKNCNNIFDSWFASSKEYEKLKKLKYISCHLCNSLSVDKNLMTPNVLIAKTKRSTSLEDKKYSKVRNKIREYQKFIKNNFKYVGDNFSHEARSIHYDSKRRSSGIYGKASMKEVKELREEGIDTEIIPWFHKKDN